MPDLKPLPNTFAATREALHRVAEQLVAPARKPPNEIALTATPGGFGTPPFEFGSERLQVRVVGVELVVTSDGGERRAALGSLAEGGALLGPVLLPEGVPEDTGALELDAAAADRLGDFYAFAADLLGRFKADLAAGADASDINLWPEHFDIALEAGAEADGQRANYGASPGDEDHPQPYLYVGPWTPQPEGELWNATAFAGAELGYAELLAADDQAATALDFLRARFEALA